jgi:Ca-activated chloride channel homolog
VTPASLFNDPKARRFALMGAAGCLLGAIAGQLLLAATASHAPPVPSRLVCLLIDCSGSMDLRGPGGEMKVDEVKQAAIGFVERHNTPTDRIAVVGFGTAAQRAASLADDPHRLRRAIEDLRDGGSTAMDVGLRAAAEELDDLPDDLRGQDIPRGILLFTDGEPDNADATVAAARACREQRTKLVAIGTGDAKTDFLERLTGDRKLVFHVDAGDFDEGFKQAEKAIYGGSLVEAGGRRQSAVIELMRTAGWTMLVACALALALVVGQNLYMRRPPLSGREGPTAAIGGLVAGLVAGAVGQLLYELATASAGLPGVGALAGELVPLGRVVGWTLLGTLVGAGLASFVPNLDRRRAALGGAAGGLIGAVAFLLASQVSGMLGALAGAAILGAAIGIMLAWVEAAFRQAWLEVHYGSEVIRVSLGAVPVRVGGDGRACQVYARGARPLAYQYTLKDGQIECVDFATERSSIVAADSEQTVGGVRVIVRASHGMAANGAPSAAMRVSAPPPPRTAHASAPAPPDALAPGAKSPARTLAAPAPHAPAAPAIVTPRCAAARCSSAGRASTGGFTHRFAAEYAVAAIGQRSSRGASSRSSATTA